MNNAQTYVLISIASVLLVGAWSLYLAVKLDKARTEIKEIKKLLKLWEPPF